MTALDDIDSWRTVLAVLINRLMPKAIGLTLIARLMNKEIRTRVHTAVLWENDENKRNVVKNGGQKLHNK